MARGGAVPMDWSRHPEFKPVNALTSEPMQIPPKPVFRDVGRVHRQDRHGYDRKHAISKDGLTGTVTGGSRHRPTFSVDVSDLDIFADNVQGLLPAGRSRRHVHDVSYELDRLSTLYGGRSRIPTKTVNELYRRNARTDYEYRKTAIEPLGSFYD